jgi:hypothetical protein
MIIFLFYYYLENASRICYENNTWGLTDYNECTILKDPKEMVYEEEDTVDTIIYLYIAGHCLSLVMTSLAIFVFSRFK